MIKKGIERCIERYRVIERYEEIQRGIGRGIERYREV